MIMGVLEEMARDELAEATAHGEPTWDRAGFEAEYELVGYCEPLFVVVRRKADQVLGTLEYVDRGGWPWWFFNFKAA